MMPPFVQTSSETPSATRAWSPRDRCALGGALAVSHLCIGSVADPATIVEAFEAGVNFFFVSADMHWPYYRQTRRGLEILFDRGVRDEVVVAGVSYVTQPEFCHIPFRELVEEVRGLERLDVTVIGGSYAADFMSRRMEYQRHRASGVRAVGCTFHDRRSASLAVNGGLLDIAYVRYNAAHAGAEDDVFPNIARTRNALLYNFKSADGYVNEARLEQLRVGNDKWRPRVVDHYRFAMSRPELDGILLAPQTPRQLREALDAVAEGALGAEEVEYLKTLCMLDSGELEVDRSEI
jgi:hypothetical protein